MVYPKLVRDLIPDIIVANGQSLRSHVAEDEEYILRLMDKLREEVEEFVENPCREEMADVLEVLRAIREQRGWTEVKIQEAVRQKREKRGGFEKRIIIDTVE